ncbi:hypothetical protein GOBAR_AA30509 [Gossypium barbadense]|uniref:Uncharacterized protein n=1 Tax=Gossypium barbadense TaxID=3634 RepID=A0A2P5WGJ6_GOSBA|nr:hypothetical protein GOBAR_AA30509 [Gossypium barbadense]
MDQVHESQVLVSKLCDLKVIILELLQAKAIFSKLPSSWNTYWKKLLHMAEDFTVEKILSHLCIEEKRHYIKDCKLLKKKQETTTFKTNIVEDIDSMAMVTEGIKSLEIGVDRGAWDRR